ARITNVGQLVAEDVVARLDTVFGLQLARGSAAERYIGPVQPGETVEVTWHLVPTGVVGNLPVSLRLTSSNASIGRLPTAFVAVPLLESVLRVTVDDEAAVRKEAVVGDLFTVYIHAENVREFYGAALELRVGPSGLQVLGGRRGVDRGRAFGVVDPATGQETELDSRTPMVNNERGVVRTAGS